MHKNSLSSALIILSISICLAWGISNAVDDNNLKDNNDSEEIRHPSAAGSFYPETASELRKTITAMMNSVPEMSPEGEIFAAIAPHAGYVYSGTVAAYTFKQLSKVDFDTIVIIGHETDLYPNIIAYICPVDYFETPLGKVPVDREMIKKMVAFNNGIRTNRSIHANDHSIEVQIPFLQVLGKNCMIVPILFGNSTPENSRILADAIIASAGDKKVFVLASTDMSHYPSYGSANMVDSSTLEVLKTMDVSRLFEYLYEQVNRQTIPNLVTAMCSRGGVGTAILFAKAHGANHAQILHYANSGDISMGDKQRVVGYSSVLFVKTADSD
jgi:AmmeMemoRadiSam system protein B